MLEDLVRAKPNDAFPRYGLALELKGLGRNEDAAREFQALTERGNHTCIFPLEETPH